MKSIKKIYEKVENFVLKRKIILDQKGGPGLEEAALLVFIGVAVAGGASLLSVEITKIFTKVITDIKAAIGITG